MNLPGDDFSSSVSRLPWRVRREVYIEAALLEQADPNALADQTDDRIEGWRLEEGGDL